MNNECHSNTYVIKGNLAAFSRMDMDKKRIWDATTSFRTNSSISLQRQHGGQRKFEGPLHVDCTFFLEYPGNRTQKRRHDGTPHLSKPYLSTLIYFIERVGIDFLYESGSHIYSITSRKVYDHDARTEFTIREI